MGWGLNHMKTATILIFFFNLAADTAGGFTRRMRPTIRKSTTVPCHFSVYNKTAVSHLALKKCQMLVANTLIIWSDPGVSSMMHCLLSTVSKYHQAVALWKMSSSEKNKSDVSQFTVFLPKSLSPLGS